MKNIIIQQGIGANFHIRMSLYNSFRAAGYNIYHWNDTGKSAFDLFAEFPDCELFMGSSWQMSRSLVKCLNNKPNIKIVLWADIYGEIQKDLDFKKYPVGIATKEQINLIDSLKSIPFIISNHGKEDIEYTHGYWRKLGCKPNSLLTSADITIFYPRPKDNYYQTQLFFCGGFWDYKSITLNKYITPLAYPNTKWKIRIAGGGWSIVNSIGMITDDESAKHYSNSQIIPHVTELHACEVYSDIPLRYTQTASCGGFGISCPCKGIREIFTEDELVVADNPQDFFEKIVYFLNNPQDTLTYREKALRKVLSGHTGFDRCEQIFSLIGDNVDSLKAAKERVIQEKFK